jgi:hypothetical protein
VRPSTSMSAYTVTTRLEPFIPPRFRGPGHSEKRKRYYPVSTVHGPGAVPHCHWHSDQRHVNVIVTVGKHTSTADSAESILRDLDAAHIVA